MATLIGANVYIDGVKHNVSPVGTVSGDEVTLTGYDISDVVSPGASFEVQFTKVYDNGTETAKSPAETYTLAATGDTTAPTIQSATIEDAAPSDLVVVFSETVNITDITGLSITGTGAPTINSVTGTGTNTLTFVLSAAATGGESWTLDVAGTNTITDNASNALAATTQAITNNVAAASGTYEAVWTLDKIDNPSYAGASIQVRRLDGSATQDIGFVGDELDTAAIDAMASTDTVQVITIYDKTGNGNHLTYGTGTRPIIKPGGSPVFTQGGRPAIRFASLDTRLTGSPLLTAENGLTVFVVHYNDTTTGSNTGIFGKWNGTGNEYLLASRHFASPNDVSFVSQDAASLQNNLQSGTVLSTKSLRLFTTLYNPATSAKSLRINGSEVAAATADIRASDAPFQLGGYSGNTNNPMFVSEIRLAKSYLSDFATRETDIKTKYGIV